MRYGNLRAIKINISVRWLAKDCEKKDRLNAKPTRNMLQITVQPSLPCTFKFVQVGNQILMSSALEFGNVAFPEFEELDVQEKVRIYISLYDMYNFFSGTS